MRNRKIVIGSLAITCIIAGTWWVIHVLDVRKNQVQAPVVAPDPLAPNPKLESRYEELVQAILEPFFSQQTVVGIKQQLLDTVAPAAYIPVHLELVLAFDLIEQGRTKSDQSLIEDGFAKIEKLADQYRWLK